MSGFILDTLGWQLCNWYKTLSLKFNKMTTLALHNKQPFSIPNSFCVQAKFLSLPCSMLISQFPFNTLSTTQAMILSLLLSLSIPLNLLVNSLIVINLFPKNLCLVLLYYLVAAVNDSRHLHLNWSYLGGRLTYIDNLIRMTTISEFVLLR